MNEEINERIKSRVRTIRSFIDLPSNKDIESGIDKIEIENGGTEDKISYIDRNN